MYKVGFKEFTSYEEVVDYAWDEFKINIAFHYFLSEEEKQDTCYELDCLINEQGI